jgi:drug/metabolite transporter (DMT)-like permease
MTTNNPPVSRRGVLIALIGTVIWAMTGVFIDYLLGHYPLAPLTLAFWRDLFASLALFALLALWRPRYLRISRRDLPFLFLFGSGILALFNALWTFSVKFNGGAVGTVLAYSSPAFIVLLAKPLLGEQLTPRRLVAVALSLTGCVLVSRAYSPDAWQVNPLGIAIGLASGIAFAIYTLTGRWGERRFPNPITMMPYGFLFAALTLGLLAITTAPPAGLFSLGTRWDGWGILALLAVGPTIGGYGLYAVSMRYLEASVAGLIASLEPAFTAVMALFVLGRWLDLEQWGGTALILAAVVIVQTSGKVKT